MAKPSRKNCAKYTREKSTVNRNTLLFIIIQIRIESHTQNKQYKITL
jgi:hypothetical protein